jgi:peptidoglycan/LPS O-acetylase OafA/YrhL
LIGGLLIWLPMLLGFLSLGEESSPVLHSVAIASISNLMGIFFVWIILLFETSSIKFTNNNFSKAYAKLTYGIYLVHPILILYFLSSRTEVFDFSFLFHVSELTHLEGLSASIIWFQAELIFKVLVASSALALVLYLLLEQPFIRLGNFIFSSKAKDTSYQLDMVK